MNKKRLITDREVTYIIIIIVLAILTIYLITATILKGEWNKLDCEMWKSACKDGCGFANDLINETFICWGKCNEYINNICKDVRK